MRAAAALPELAGIASVWASTETKAIEGAGLLAGALGLGVGVHPGLGENDRSATGYLPREEFEQVADAFFARPHDSVRGWERAADAQARVLAAVEAVLAAAPPGDVAIVAHGGVGALLLAALSGRPISRGLDQPGQGCRYAFGRADRALRHGWVALPEA
ncbi:histidine phosphatase family protein [Roseomonas sp. OT10]|nr:histidine phosphatase family protein [Roseomonas sp. OT10]